jgi:hypothetical protein
MILSLFVVAVETLKKLDDTPYVKYLISIFGDAKRKQGYVSHRKTKSFRNSR